MLAVGGHALVAVAVAERWPLSRGSNKSQCMDCPPVQKSGHCKEVAISGGSTFYNFNHYSAKY